MHDEFLIDGNQIYLKDAKDENLVCIRVRLPWYRGLPMSCVDSLDFTIDGQQISREDVKLNTDGVVYPQAELLKLHDKVWFLLDVKEAQIRLDEPLSVGEHDVKLILQLTIPYLEEEDQYDYIQYGVYEKTMKYEGEQL